MQQWKIFQLSECTFRFCFSLTVTQHQSVVSEKKPIHGWLTVHGIHLDPASGQLRAGRTGAEDDVLDASLNGTVDNNFSQIKFGGSRWIGENLIQSLSV